MKNLAGALSAGLLAVSFVAHGDGAPSLPPQNQARIAEIERHLPQKPGLPGLRPEDRLRWRALADKSPTRKAEEALAGGVPPITDEVYLKCRDHGDANVQPQAYWKRHAALSALAFAEAFEQRGRFLPKIAEFLNAYCDEKSWLFAVHDGNADVFFGRLPPKIDLGVAHRAELLGFTLALHRDRLPADTVRRTEDALEKWAFAPYRRLAASATNRVAAGREGWFAEIYNWNASCNAGVLYGALNVLADRHDRAVFAEAAERSSRNYLKGLTSDGYCLEGTGYWAYGYSRYLLLGLTLRAATGGFVDLFADPVNRRTVVDYAYGAKLFPGGGLPFADGTSAIGPATLAMARRVWPDVASSEVLKVSPWRLDGAFPFMALGEPLPEVKPTLDVLPIRTTFESAAQTFIFRPDPAAPKPPRELAFAIKGGSNGEPHNHNDVGSYQLTLDRKAVCGDPMGVVYSRQIWGSRRYLDFPTLSSYGHPVPRPANTNQSPGERFAGKVVSTDFTPERDAVTLELAGAYPTNCSLKSLLRTVRFDRKALCVTVTDKVAFSSPQPFDTPIVTYADAIFDYEKQNLTLQVDKDVRMGVEVSAKGGDWHWDTAVLPNQCSVSPKRLAVAFDKPVTEVEVTFAYRVKR